MHPLLKRQLKRLGLDDASGPPSLETWQQLLDRVSQSYLESDQGRELLERSIALSATEMQELNEQLRRTSESQLTQERDKLQTVLRSMGDGLCVVDSNWAIVLLNPEGARLWASLNTRLSVDGFTTSFRCHLPLTPRKPLSLPFS